MTACRNKARGAVVAALAGALTLGAAPVMALADGAQMMATSSQEAFAAGTVSAENGRGEAVTFPEKDLVTFTEESGEYLLPTSINVNGSDIALNLLSGTGNAKVVYKDATGKIVAAVGKGFVGRDGVPLAKNYDWKAGNYTAEIQFMDEGSQYEGCNKIVSFKIVEARLEDATIFNATDDNEDTTVTGLSYTGEAIELGLAVDGAVIDLEDYELTVFKTDSSTQVSKSTDAAAAYVTDAGDYIAYLDTADGERVKEITFSVAKLDLAKAALTYPDRMDGRDNFDSNLVKLNGKALPAAVTGRLTVTEHYDAAKPGVYTVSVTSSDEANVTGTATIRFAWLDNGAKYYTKAQFTYDGVAFDSYNDTIDLSAGQYFDVEKIKVGDLDWDDDLVDITYTNVAGEAVDASDLDTPGTYYVTVRVNAERAQWKAGSDTNVLTVKVTGGEITGEDVTFTYGGEVTNNLTGEAALTYDGSDFMEKIAATVKVGKATLTQGSDYELVILDESGKKVDSITNAGSYTVLVESDTFDVDNSDQGCELPVEVKAIDLDYLYAESALMKDFGGRVILPYTGEDIDAGFEFAFYTKDGKVEKKGTEGATRNVLPEGAVRVDGIKYLEEYNAGQSDWNKADVVDAINAEGYYKLVVTLVPEVAVNYTYNGGADGSLVTNDVEVSKDRVFLDVANDDWFSEYVYQCRNNKWMTGYGEGMFFGPADSIKRGDVAMTLYRMAGQPDFTDEGSYDEHKGYVTGFSDVDGNAYYAKAILWAKSAGIVSGDEGKDTFRPNDTVTREELAKMLAIFAAKCGEDTDVDVDAVLGEYEDESSVSGWARGYVAYLVEAGVMGQDSGLEGNEPISRAEVAAMAVRLSDIFDFDIMA